MSRISSLTLFNFTDSLDFLLDNLEMGFYCGYHYEKLPIKQNGYVVPMACFCDIPLSLIDEHFDWYGRYGIGIRRSYARRHGVRPVWYITSENEYVKSLATNKLSDLEIKYVLPYLKQFIGDQEYKDGSKRKKFYDEREWRYIPKNILCETHFGKKEKPELPVKQPERMGLDLNEVKYIIIDKEKEFKVVVEKIKVICYNRSIDPDILISKIITSRQIDQDF